jgi:hypothetical protein
MLAHLCLAQLVVCAYGTATCCSEHVGACSQVCAGLLRCCWIGMACNVCLSAWWWMWVSDLAAGSSQ